MVGYREEKELFRIKTNIIADREQRRRMINTKKYLRWKYSYGTWNTKSRGKSLEAFEMWRCLRFRGKRTKVPRGKRKILRNYKKIKGAISFWWIRLLFESRTAADGKIGRVKLYEFLKAMRKRNANEQFKEYWVLTEERVESKRPRDLKSKRLFYIIHLCENDGLFVFE